MKMPFLILVLGVSLIPCDCFTQSKTVVLEGELKAVYSQLTGNVYENRLIERLSFQMLYAGAGVLLGNHVKLGFHHALPAKTTIRDNWVDNAQAQMSYSGVSLQFTAGNKSIKWRPYVTLNYSKLHIQASASWPESNLPEEHDYKLDHYSNMFSADFGLERKITRNLDWKIAEVKVLALEKVPGYVLDGAVWFGSGLQYHFRTKSK